MDLADAHLSSLEKLIKNQKSDIYNIGNNQGFSVKEIISMAEKVTQSKIPYEITSRRKGDPSELIADNKKISENLNWSANYSDLQTILETAWEWEKRLSRSN
jgi:UDP-glucose 4-epimerase